MCIHVILINQESINLQPSTFWEAGIFPNGDQVVLQYSWYLSSCCLPEYRLLCSSQREKVLKTPCVVRTADTAKELRFFVPFLYHWVWFELFLTRMLLDFASGICVSTFLCNLAWCYAIVFGTRFHFLQCCVMILENSTEDFKSFEDHSAVRWLWLVTCLWYLFAFWCCTK